MLSQCSLLEVLDQNRPLCWSIVVRENPKFGAPFSGLFLVTASPKRRRMSLYICIFSFTIYVMQQGLKIILMNSGNVFEGTPYYCSSKNDPVL